MTVNLLCPVAVIRSRLERERGVHAAGAGPSLLETLHLQANTCWVSVDASMTALDPSRVCWHNIGTIHAKMRSNAFHMI